MASVPGPPPSTREHGHTGVASVRLRRTGALKTGDASKSVAPSAASNQDTGKSDRRAAAARANRQDTRRDQLFNFQRPRREQLESTSIIAALQENVSALTIFNKREKALSASLKEQVTQLTEALAQLKETQEEEKKKVAQAKEKKEAAQQKQITTRESETRFLPDILTGSVLTTSTAALQQQTQMEVSYQRKVLSLENRCAHMTENNKKLLARIQQLENSQKEANVQLGDLRQDNARLVAVVEDLNSTILSQSSLVVGLRSTVQKLSHDEKLVEHLRRTLERCQREVEAVKKREKLLQEEHSKLKASTSQEKEVLVSKILGFQQDLQRNDAASGNVTILDAKVKGLQKEKEALEIDVQTSNARCDGLQTRVAQLERVLEDFVEVKRTMETEKANIESILATARQELETCIHKLKEAEKRAQEAEERTLGVKELTDLLQTRNEEVNTLMQKVMALEDTVVERDQRCAGIQGELDKVTTELQGIKQLSHDETVQALQMARQKAATYEALTLLNEEKKALEEQLRLVQERLEAEQVALQEQKDAKEHALAALDTHTLTLEELRKENIALLQQMKNSSVVERAVTELTELNTQTIEVSVQTIEESVSAETYAQTATELEEATNELQSLQSQFDELQQTHDELQNEIEGLRQSQDQIEFGYKKAVSRERYKSESFQSQLKLLQNENGELSEKMGVLYKDLEKEQQLNDVQTIEMTDLKQRVLSREAIYLLRKTQDSLEKTVNSILEAEHASEGTFTCLQCMQLFTQPMTLVPCGHTYCAACLAKCGDVDVPTSIACKMCETGVKKETECIFPNYALADLTARFIFRQQSLASLTTMCLSLRKSFTQHGSNSKSTATLATIEAELS